MSVYESALSFAVRHLVPVDEDAGAEIVRTAIEATDGRSISRRVRELMSMVGLGLRLRGHRATGDDRRQILAQAASLGGALVLLATAAWVWADADTVDLSTVLIVTVIGSGAVVSPRLVQVVLGGVGAISLLVFGTFATAPVIAGLTIGIVLTVAGSTVWAHSFRPWLAMPVIAVVITEAIGFAVVGSGWLTTGVLTVLAAGGPLAFLAVGWFDPRFALVATAVWFWRLAAVDLVDLAGAGMDLGRELTLDVLIVRWLVMGAGVLIGLAVSQRSLHRCTTL